MAVFTQVHNPLTGKMEWGIQREDYDFVQEVARSSYADMLHDKERNEKYFKGLKSTIADMRNEGKEVHVLDIGTGTGLLSMMAVSCGADSVTACEAFTPMAKCAKKILDINNCGNKVNLIPKRSTEIIVGEDMKQRANILVTEVFDTELIGEGAIETFRHAQEHLLTEDAKIVPSEGVVYAQVVSSDILKKWNKLLPISRNKNDQVLKVPESFDSCPGSAGVHDVQMSELKRKWFKTLSPPVKIFWFDWSGQKKEISRQETMKNDITFSESGSCDAVFMWWDLKMDQRGDVNLSCAPVWAHPFNKDNKLSSSDIPWRDHWMQALYYLPRSVNVKKNDTYTLVSSHDEYSLWFDMINKDKNEIPEKRPMCTCGLHLLSRSRIGQMNDSKRRDVLMRQLEKNITYDSVCLCLGDSCIYAIAAARLGANHVYISENNITRSRFLKQIIEDNKVEDRVTVFDDISQVSVDKLKKKINFIISEPFFESALLPWHTMQWWYLYNSAKHLISSKAKKLPTKMVVWGVPVQYRDLWKIRAPLDECCGFKLNIFDELIEEASNAADEIIEPHPLWEYPCTALAPAQPLLMLDMSVDIIESSVSKCGLFSLQTNGILNGMALWADWHFSSEEKDVISSGPIKNIQVGEEIEWDLYSRQGVYLMKDRIQIDKDTSIKVNFSSEFLPKQGTISLDFSVTNLGKKEEIYEPC